MVMLASQAKAKKGKAGRAKASEPDRRSAVPKGGTCVTCKAEPMLADGVRCLGCEIALCHRMSGGPGEAAVQAAAVPPAPPPPAVSGVPVMERHNVIELQLVTGLSIAFASYTDDSFNLRHIRKGVKPAAFADGIGSYPAWVPRRVGRTYGDFLRYLAELSDRLGCACGCEPTDETGETGVEDEFGNPMPPEEAFPHKRIEAGPKCCPLCAAERTPMTTELEDGGRADGWTCEECWNDAADAERALHLRQAERTPPGSHFYADALAVIGSRSPAAVADRMHPEPPRRGCRN